MLKLVIGNKNYSSWSLRAWLYLRESRLDFEEIRISLFTEDYKKKILEHSAAGLVPVLIDGERHIWDSLAIMLYCIDHFEDAVGWPQEAEARATAQSISAEIHSGYMALRDELPQNIRASEPLSLDVFSSETRSQIERVAAIWTDCRRQYRASGPWLFGKQSVADIMYAPVALRFVTYAIPMPKEAQEFVDAVRMLDSIREWSAAARLETERLDFIDQRIPATQTPLSLG